MLSDPAYPVCHLILLLQFVSSVLFLGLVLTTPALADIHPVPLEKDADTPKCLECHADKATGKNVHTAISMGCTSCHEIRVNKDVTRVKLITTTPSALCFTCHADKNPAEIKGIVHKPAVRDCLKCHDPHESENKYQLVKPTSGATEKDNLCLSCHSTGLGVPANGSRHPALDMGCDACHVVHKTGETGKAEFDFHLAKAAPALCLDCHDPKDADLQKAHQGQPFGTADCIECHDPHQSGTPKLMAMFTHPPFADKQCDACHAPSKDGKVVLTQADAKSLCVMCHDDKATQIESAKVLHPGAMGDCTDCHSPHASKYPGLPKTNPVDICLECHSEQVQQGTKKYLHRPAFYSGCGTCHEPHGGDGEKLLRVKSLKDVNTLCLECHGPDAQPVRLDEKHLVAIFDGTVKLPDSEWKKTPILPIQYGLGHPTKGHPVASAYNTKTNTKAELTCLTCHQPHSSARPDLLVNDQEPNMAFCKTCHNEGTLTVH